MHYRSSAMVGAGKQYHYSMEAHIRHRGIPDVARFEGGWVKLYRSAVTEDIGANPNCLALWIHLLSLASVYESKTRLNGEQIGIVPGTIVTGIHDLAEMSGIPKSTIHRQLKYLEQTQRIVRKSGNEGSIITICNWEKYQAAFFEAGNERETDGKRTGNGRTPNEEYKNIRKKETYTPECVDSRFDFESVYQSYPRKMGKGKGLARCKAQVKTPEDFDALNAAVRNYTEEMRRSQTEQKYIKHFSSFMGEWRDWINFNSKPSGGLAIVSECAACTRGIIRAKNRSSLIVEDTACTCIAGRARGTFVRFDETKHERIGAA